MGDPFFSEWFNGLTNDERDIIHQIERGLEQYRSERPKYAGQRFELLNLKHFTHGAVSNWRIDQIDEDLHWVDEWRRWSNAAKRSLTKVINAHGGLYDVMHGATSTYGLGASLYRLKTNLDASFANLADVREDLIDMKNKFEAR